MTRSKTEKQIAASRRNAYKMGTAPKTDKQREASRKTGRKNVKLAQKIAYSLPRSIKQKKQFYDLSQRPRTEAQWKAIYRNLKKAGVFADSIIKHHNDLCHGTLRSDDITYMTHSEHGRLHMELRIKYGNPPWIKKELLI